MKIRYPLLAGVFFTFTALTQSVAQGQYFSSGEARLYYEVIGKGQPLVLIHGFSLDSRMWTPQWQRLGKRYRAVRYDVRGFGRSSRATGPHDPAADLLALLDHLQIARAHLIGLSMGANIALNFAARYPERVLRVVAADPNLDGFAEYTPELFAAFGQVFGAVAQKGWTAETQQLWLQTPLLRLQNATPTAQALVESMVRDYNGDQFTNPAAAPQYGEPPTAAQLEKLKVPVLVLVGENDEESIQRIARLVAQKAPQAQLTVIPKAGHLSNLDQPKRFHRAVVQFLKN